MGLFGALARAASAPVRALAATGRAVSTRSKSGLRRAWAGGQAAYQVGKEGARVAPLMLNPQGGPVPPPPTVAQARDTAIVQEAPAEVAARYPGTKAAEQQRATAEQRSWADNELTRRKTGDLRPRVDTSRAPSTSQTTTPKTPTSRAERAKQASRSTPSPGRAATRSKGTGRGR